jgi:hypothetical protein
MTLHSKNTASFLIHKYYHSISCLNLPYNIITAQPIAPASATGTLTTSAASVNSGNLDVPDTPVPVGITAVPFEVGKTSVGTVAVVGTTSVGDEGKIRVVRSVSVVPVRCGTSDGRAKLLESTMPETLVDGSGGGGIQLLSDADGWGGIKLLRSMMPVKLVKLDGILVTTETVRVAVIVIVSQVVAVGSSSVGPRNQSEEGGTSYPDD